jgi:hypothetical protein
MELIKRLFYKSGAIEKQATLSIEVAHRIVQDYADFLKTSAPLPGRVADETQLPHGKEIIKDALALCIQCIKDIELTEHLKQGYLMLSAWQHDVGEKSLGLDFTCLDLDADPLELAEAIQQQSATIKPWEQQIRVEQRQLSSELRKLGI